MAWPRERKTLAPPAARAYHGNTNLPGSAMLPTLLSLLLAAPPIGVLPAGADGKPLNLDFETGTLKDWTADGTAFRGQPIKGNTVTPRRGDQASNHQGDYWIGGFEKAGDKPTGTLTSVAFTVTHPRASFLVGGGPWPETCVELVALSSGVLTFADAREFLRFTHVRYRSTKASMSASLLAVRQDSPVQISQILLTKLLSTLPVTTKKS